MQRLLPHLPRPCSTHVGARHPVVAVTLRKLAELELAAAAAEEAAADTASSGKASSGDASSADPSGGKAAAAPATSLKDRERQQAVAIAQEALSIAQQAYGEALEWEHKRGQPEEGGLLSWLRPAKPQLAALRRPQRPDAAALEVVQCLQALSHAHAAVQEAAQAVADLEAGLQLLDGAFPAAAAARAAGSVDEDEMERRDEQEVSAAPSSNSDSSSGTDEEEQAGGGDSADSNARSAASFAAAVGAKEAARAMRVERARKAQACGMLAELLTLAAGGHADLQAVQQRFAQEGCGGAGAKR